MEHNHPILEIGEVDKVLFDFGYFFGYGRGLSIQEVMMVFLKSP